jgi:hypothetical protein
MAGRDFKYALLKLEKGKLLERVGRKAVSLNLSGDEQGCLVAGPNFILVS